jgi:hypothetical protein
MWNMQIVIIHSILSKSSSWVLDLPILTLTFQHPFKTPVESTEPKK